MKRNRRGMIMVVVLVFLVLASALLFPAITQNLTVRGYIIQAFVAIQRNDATKLQQLYLQNAGVNPSYYQQLAKYTLHGWKINSVSGQPWPMDDTEEFHQVVAELYYTGLPETLLKPQGRYATMVHPKFGACAVVPVVINFAYDKQHNIFELQAPMPSSANNWMCPFEQVGR